MQQHEDTSQEHQKQRKRKYIHFAIVLAILLGISLFTWLWNEQAVGMEWNETFLSVTDPGGNTYTVLYRDVTSATLEDCPDLGECISGGTKSGWSYGVWENATWGQYSLCAMETDKVIVLRETDSVFVFSYESDSTTVALYASLLELLSDASAS